jgi:2-polyprenyl-3-methyl-5-hydroxy-6-metoxy-1,4-benzoquinol methylase
MGYKIKPECEVCGSVGHSLYSELPDSTFGNAALGSISKCSNSGCQTLWANPFPDAKTIFSFYKHYYTHDAGAADTRASSARPALKSLIKSIVETLPFLPAQFSPSLRYLRKLPPGRLLDVGCGNGAFLADAAEHGWQVYGQEFDAKAAEVANKSSGAEVRLGDLLEVGFEHSSFDAITLSNVLEHLHNPREIVTEACRLLKPGGTFVSISPNPNSYLHTKFGQSWRGLEVPRHLFLLPPAALREIASDAGFSAIEAFSVMGAFDFMERASMEIREKEFPNKDAIPPATKLQRMSLRMKTLLGRDVGEWAVVVAQR